MMTTLVKKKCFLSLMISLWVFALLTAPVLAAQGTSPTDTAGDAKAKQAQSLIGVSNATGVNIRQSPGTSAKIVGRISQKGAVYTVLAREGDWAKVALGQGQGWVFAKFLDISEAESEAEKPSTAAAGTQDSAAATSNETQNVPPAAQAAEKTGKPLAGTAAAVSEKKAPTPPVSDGADDTPASRKTPSKTDTMTAVEEEVEVEEFEGDSAQPSSPKTESEADTMATTDEDAEIEEEVEEFEGDVQLDAPMPGYQQALQKAMDMVFIFLESIEKREDIGPEEKKQKAIEFLRNVRWGPEERYYFWINDLDGMMLLEPLYPQTEGENVIRFKDMNSRDIFVEFIKVVLDHGQSFVDHNGLGYDYNLNPRVSLVKIFESWDWVVGTYVELDDVETYEEIDDELKFVIPFSPVVDETPASPI